VPSRFWSSAAVAIVWRQPSPALPMPRARLLVTDTMIALTTPWLCSPLRPRAAARPQSLPLP
jgi:hypothetical protein